MNRIGIAKFEKVSYEQFKKDCLNLFPYMTEERIKSTYNEILLPKRSTTGSAGYDFYLPEEVALQKGDSIVIPTGIRCFIEDGWVLAAFPRSGHGFKYGIHLANTNGIIDSDYYDAENEGHIQIKLVNDSSLAKDISFEQHTAFCQGIFLPFGITVDDEVYAKRTGGFGSTDDSIWMFPSK